MSDQIHIGIDTGGTFTDFFVYDAERASVRVHKVLSTPDAPDKAILQGLADLGIDYSDPKGGLRFVHGTTIGTNAVLQGRGLATAYVTNSGLADLLTLGRQTREHIYQLVQPEVPPPVPPELLFEVNARLDASGQRTEPLAPRDATELAARLHRLDIRAVAINLLYSWLDDTDEKALEDAILQAGDGLFVSRSSFVLPQYREYERGIATWLNASTGPVLEHYLARLDQHLSAGHLTVMQSSGLTISAEQAARRAVNLLLSGPAGGIAAASAIGARINRTRLLTFDMGGTSTDVSLIDRHISLTSEGRIGRWPVSLPMADIHTIGAGGGSIAFVDPGGALQVGPASAGADPGPACYGQGGDKPTVTDASMLLGLLPGHLRMAGSLPLDAGAAEKAVGQLAEQLQLDPLVTARGILDIANANMAEALRHISLQRGYDPGEFNLVCFGGAAGLHLCDLAEALGMQEAIVPVHSGVLSALGLIYAAPGRQLSQTLNQPLREPGTLSRVTDIFQNLENQGRRELAEEGVTDGLQTRKWLDIRYFGQSHPLEIDLADAQVMEQDFILRHKERYGHTLDAKTEIVTAHLSIKGEALRLETGTQEKSAASFPKARVYGLAEEVEVLSRAALQQGKVYQGPLLIAEATATTWIKPDWELRLLDEGSLLARHASSG